MKLLAILIMFIGIDAYADAQKQVPECATTKEGVREIIMAKWNYSEGKTSYLDGLAGTWGVAGDDSAEGVVIHDNGALAIGSHYITVCPQ